MDDATGSVITAAAVCRACEELLERVEDEWPGGEADRALERLRARVEGLLARSPATASTSTACAEGPVLEVTCLGPTRLTASGAPVVPPRRSRLVLQYLIAHRRRPVQRDVLLEAFWPGSSPRAARNSLNVAITLLRRAFRPVYGDCPIVVFRDEAYSLAPGLEVRVDYEAFVRHMREGDVLRRAGELREAVAAYRPRRRPLRRAAVRGRALRGVDRHRAPRGRGAAPRRPRPPGGLPRGPRRPRGERRGVPPHPGRRAAPRRRPRPAGRALRGHGPAGPRAAPRAPLRNARQPHVIAA